MATASAVIGGAGLVYNIIQGDKASKEAAAARAAAGDQHAAAMLKMEEAVRQLEATGVPSIEAQRIVMEKPELVGLQEIHQLATSKMEDIEVDPALKQQQYESLQGIQDIAETGRTAGEKAEEMLDTQRVASEEGARRKAILQKMAEQGMSGSGASLAAQLQGSQSASNRRAMMQAQRIADREARKQAAIQQAAQMASGMRSQDFGEQSQVASAADRIAQFNLQNRMNVEAANLARQQAIADEGVRLGNVQEQYNKGLIAQKYQQEMDKAKAVANVKTGQANQSTTRAGQLAQEGQAAAAGQISKGAAVMGAAGQVAGYLADKKFDFGGSGSTPDYDVSNNMPAPSSMPQAVQDGGVVMSQEDIIKKKKEEELQAEEQMKHAHGQNMMQTMYAEGGVAPMMLDQQASQPHPMSPQLESPSQTGYAGGGIALMAEDEEIIPGDDFAGDRVDAKINSGEMVLNVEQQQRLMDLLKGYRDLSGLGDENIVERPPVSDPEVELPPDLPSTPPPSIPNEYAHGGVVKANGMHVELSKMHDKLLDSEEELKKAQKDTKAKVKALKTLLGDKIYG